MYSSMYLDKPMAYHCQAVVKIQRQGNTSFEYYCCVSIHELQPLEDPAYAVCKGCVLHGQVELEPGTIT